MSATETRQLDARTLQTRMHWEGAPISARRAYELCASSEAFRTALLTELARAPFPAYFWETPALTSSSLERPFEYVISDAPGLAGASPEVEAFAEHFDGAADSGDVVSFENLGRDALLVVPCPKAEHVHYAHLAAFVRGAPEAQTHALLVALGNAVLGRVSARPLWVSTAGMGVYWLHVRLDSRPKYYRYAAYKRA